MIRPRRGLWSRVLALCLLAVMTPAGPAAPAGAQPAKEPKGTPIRVDFFDDPVGRLAFELRERPGAPGYLSRPGSTGGGANLNFAVGFVDITGLKDVDTRSFRTLDVETLKTQNRPLYDRLGLAARPWVRTLLLVSDINTPLRTVGGNPEYALHSEQRILRILQGQGIPRERLVALYTDRSPCADRCTPIIPRGTTVFYVVRDRRGSSGALEREINAAKARFFDEKEAAKAAARARDAATLFDPEPDPPGPAGGGLPKALAQPGGGAPGGGAPGGIDLSSLRLRWLADAGAGGGLRYAFTARRAGGDPRAAAGLRAAKEASDAFFVWLTLPTSTFTVNLNPNEPDRVIDAQLGRTEAGRVLLEADLRLKQTTARLLHPDTRLGARFWRELPGNSNPFVDCNVFRQWIVPAPATVYEQEGELYILDAPLSVKLEGEDVGPGAIRSPLCAGHQERLQALLRRLVLPKVEHAVNTAPEYAALRRVYLSRVAAEWYRQRSLTRRTPLSDLIDRGDVTPWASRRPWDPKDVFRRYVRSYTKGEFKVTRRTRSGGVIETSTYSFGGVDFTRVPRHTVAAQELQRRWPGLPETVRQALGRPVSGPRDREVWLGGVTPAAAAPSPPAARRPGPVTLLLLVIGLSCLLGAGRLARPRAHDRPPPR